MNHDTPAIPLDGPRAALPALLGAAAGLALGLASAWTGIAGGSLALLGFGAAGLLQVPLALVVAGRVRRGLGNRGLDGERRAIRATGHLLLLLAAGLALACGAALYAHREPDSARAAILLGGLAMALLAPLWRAKTALAGAGPTLALDAVRARTALELAALVLGGGLLALWAPAWGDAAAGLALSLRLALEGRALRRTVKLPPACGGCGTGCG